MSRVVLFEGSPESAGCDAVLVLEPTAPGDETALRDAFTAALAGAGRGGATRVAVAPDARALGFGAQPCAELLIALAQRSGSVEEVHFALDGEPTYRIYEAVHDAARIAEQMRRLRGDPA